MCVLSLIYSHVAVCRFCAVRCLIIFASLCYFLITRLVYFNIFYVVFLVFYVCFLFCVCVLICVLFLILFIAVSLLFLYKFTDHCRRVEIQTQYINITSRIIYEI
jgi:hypothetical protein